MLSDSIAIIPGSFDPITIGHVDVIRRASALFERTWVAVVGNPAKDSLFSADERVGLVRDATKDLAGVDVVAFDGLTVDLAARVGARWIVRGLRSVEDAIDELPMAHSNRRCGREEVETLFLPTSASLSFISSRLVRQIAKYGGALDAFVSPGVEAALRAKFSAR